MHKVILVVGSVTAEQYKDARVRLLNQGHKPKIVRMTSEEFLSDLSATVTVQARDEILEELGMSLEELLDLDDPDKIGDLISDREEKIIVDWVTARVDVDAIGAVVLTERDWDCSMRADDDHGRQVWFALEKRWVEPARFVVRPSGWVEWMD